IQLVLETPPPPKPQPMPVPPPPEPPGRLASEDIGEVTKSGHAPSGAQEESAVQPGPQPELVPPPPPPKPIPPKEQTTALATPKAPPPVLAQPAAKPPAARHPAEETRTAAHPARVPGPSATRDEYLAYLVSLTKQHLDMLPLSLLGDRRGE